MEERGRLEKLGYPTDAKRCYQQASQLYEEALELRKKHLGVAHRDTLASLDHLGSFYLGDPFHPEWIYQPEKTLQLWTEAWRLRSASLGEKHPETLRSLDNLAYILLDPQRLNRPAEGLPLLEKAYRYRAETLGASNWVTLDRLDQLTETYLRLGRPADAVPLLENAVTRALTAGKRGVPVDLPSLSALVQSYFALGRDGQALALLARVLNQRTQTLGEKHLATLESMRDLAEAYLESDRPKEAVPLLERMTKVFIDLLNERQADPISSIDQLPVIERLVDMPPLKVTLKTEFNFNEAVHLYGMIPRHLANLAACYLLLGRPDEASPLIEKLQQPYKPPGSTVEFTWAAHPPSDTRTVLDQIKSDRNIGKSEPVILTRLKELADISLQQTVILLEHFVNIAEELRIRNELTLEDRQALFSEWVPTYKRLAMLQAQQNRLADAFRVAELSKARTLLESASIRQAKQSGVLSPADRAQLDGLEAKLQALDNALGQHREQRRAVIDLLVEKDHIARNLGALNRELMAKYPRYGRLSDVRLIEAKAGQALLPADAALISYLFDGDKLLVFVLSRERLTAKVLSIPHLNKIVRAYRQLLCKPLVAVARDACPPPEGQPLWQQTDGSLLIVF